MKFTVMYKLVAAILVGNGVGGRMATAPHYNMYANFVSPTSHINISKSMLCHWHYSISSVPKIEFESVAATVVLRNGRNSTVTGQESTVYQVLRL